MARKQKRPPIDRAFLREFLARTARHGPALPVTEEALDRFAREHLDGRTRDEQERAIVGPWLVFLAQQMQAAIRRKCAQHAARHPNQN